jgi:hypothetical protein
MTMRRRHWVYAAVGLLAALISAWLIREDLRGPDGQFWHAAPFFGSVLITVGWIVTSETAIRNSKKQHTIGMINQHRFGSIRDNNLRTIQKYLPSYTTIFTRSIVDFDDEKHELLHALDAELNFYDFAAAAVEKDDVDEALLQECLHNQLLNLFEQAGDYIAYWNGLNALTWCRAIEMRKRWLENPPKLNSGQVNRSAIGRFVDEFLWPARR